MVKIGPCALQCKRHNGKGSELKGSQGSFIASAVELLYDP